MTDAASDTYAWRAMRDGNPDGLARLYDMYSPVMFGLARRLLGSARDAEDLLQDVFLEAWQKAAQYDAERGSVRTWLLLRIRSRAIDRLRTATIARKHAVAMSPSIERLLVAPDRSASRADGCRARMALEVLSVKQRTVVELGYFHGLTCREIAERCQIPIGTVKSRLSASVAALRKQLVTDQEAAL